METLATKVLRLEADNARLRGLIERAETQGLCVDSSAVPCGCPWCHNDEHGPDDQPAEHRDDCPAFSSGGVVR